MIRLKQTIAAAIIMRLVATASTPFTSGSAEVMLDGAVMVDKTVLVEEGTGPTLLEGTEVFVGE